MHELKIRTCEEALRVLALHIDDEIDAETREHLEAHLMTCRSCYSRAEFEKRLKQQVRSLAEERVHQGLAERVQRLISTFSAADFK